MRLKLLAATTALAIVFTACAPSDGSSSTPGATSSDVSVIQLASADQSAPCRDKSALTPHATSTATEFVLTITVAAPLCTPIAAKAVIYAMPGNGVAWPQEFVKAVPFTLSAAGTVTVTFAKGCGAAQFDVLTGATPQTISSGLEHGPLLFQDVNTAQQYWGAPCGTTTTTAAPTTTVADTTTTVPDTTTTVPDTTTTTVADTTTTTEPPTTTTTSTTTTTEPPTTTTTSTTTTEPPTTTTTTTTSTTTTSTTTTTAAPTTTTTTTIPVTTTTVLPTLIYTGVADKTLGCYSGAIGDDTFHQPLGADGVWDFYFQGCTTFATETVALDDPPGGPFADAFQSPTGYQCKMDILGEGDGIGYNTNKIGAVADTGGLIFINSSSSWSSPTTWQITCIPV